MLSLKKREEFLQELPGNHGAEQMARIFHNPHELPTGWGAGL
jgi:hypothetical protein